MKSFHEPCPRCSRSCAAYEIFNGACVECRIAMPQSPERYNPWLWFAIAVLMLVIIFGVSGYEVTSAVPAEGV